MRNHLDSSTLAKRTATHFCVHSTSTSTTPRPHPRAPHIASPRASEQTADLHWNPNTFTSDGRPSLEPEHVHVRPDDFRAEDELVRLECARLQHALASRPGAGVLLVLVPALLRAHPRLRIGNNNGEEWMTSTFPPPFHAQERTSTPCPARSFNSHCPSYKEHVFPYLSFPCSYRVVYPCGSSSLNSPRCTTPLCEGGCRGGSECRV